MSRNNGVGFSKETLALIISFKAIFSKKPSHQFSLSYVDRHVFR